MDTHREPSMTADTEALATPDGWLDALVAARHGSPSPALLSLPDSEVTELMEDLHATLRWSLPLQAPDTFEEQASWLARLESLDLALRGARALHGAASWATSAAQTLEHELLARQPGVEHMSRSWWHARTADAQRADLALPDLRPWCWLSSLTARGGLEHVAAECRPDVVRSWAAGALPADDERALREAIERSDVWRDVYRTWLQQQLSETWLERFDLSLELPTLPPQLRLALPHLGRGKTLRVRATERGSRWDLPAQTIDVPAGSSEVTLPLGAALGNLRVAIHEQPLGEEELAERVLRTSRLLRKNGESNEALLTLSLRLVRWCETSLKHLESAASAFRRNEDGDDFWPRHLIEIRARLEQLADVLAHAAALGENVAPLRQALRQLDQAAEPYREAACALEEDFLQAMESSLEPPPLDAWWSPPQAPSAPELSGLKAHKQDPSRSKPRKHIPVPSPQYAAYGDSASSQDDFLQWRSDDGWEAEMNLPRRASAEQTLEIQFLDLPDTATRCWIGGTELVILRNDGSLPVARCTLGQLHQSAETSGEGLESIQVEIDGRRSIGWLDNEVT